MKRSSCYPWMLGAGALALVAGCAQAPLKVDAQSVRVAPVYRDGSPAGTAAGQYAVGRIDLAEGRTDAAIRRFHQALALDPTFVEAHNGLGVAYGQQGKYAEAAAAFRAALALVPDAPHVLNNLGFAQMKAGQLDDAWASLRRSLELEAHNERTRENLRLLAEVRRTAPASVARAELEQAREPASQSAPVAQAAPTVTPTPAAPNPPVATGNPLPAVAPAAPAPQPAAIAAAPAQPVPAAVPTVSSARPAPIIAASAPIPVQPAPVVASTPVAPQQAPAAASAPRPMIQVPSAMPIAVPSQPAVATVPAPVAPTSAAPVQERQSERQASGYRIVQSTSNDSVLVQLAPNLFELRRADAQVARVETAKPAATASPQAAAPAPAIGLLPDPMPRPIEYPRTAAAARAAAPLAMQRVEVSNAVGIRHLAGRTARKLEQLGVGVARVSDFQVFGRERTEIHYRDGHLEDAKAMRKSLPVDARLIRSARLMDGIDLRLVIGRDLVSRRIAWLDDDTTTSPTMADAVTPTHAVAAHAGVDLAPFAAKVARANVEDGWRHL